MSQHEEANYKDVKGTWTKSEFDGLRLKPQEAFFSRNNGIREGFLTILEDYPFSESSALEIGCLYDPLFLFDRKPTINRLHLSDVMYATASPFPSTSSAGISITQDSKGMPELVELFDRLNLGNAILVLENVMNYLDKDDILSILRKTGRSSIQTIVVGNDFDLKIDTVHFNRFGSKVEFLEEVTQLGFQLKRIKSWETSFVAVLSRNID